MVPAHNPTIAIIGGSLVGPACELFLRRAGYTDVTTYEAMPAAHSQSGGVMGLRLTTLELLTSIGVDPDAIMAIEDRNVYAWDVVTDGPASTIVERNVSDFPGGITAWDPLHEQFRDLVDVQTSRRLVGMVEQGGRWHLTFNRGVEADADVVVFADGRSSWGRNRLDPRRLMRYNGYTVWRGLAPVGFPIPDEWQHGFQRFYDTRHGRLFSVTEPLRHSGRSYWELSHNLPAEDYTAIVGGEPTVRSYMLPREPGPDRARLDATLSRAARHLPQVFQDMIAASDVAGIPVNDLDLAHRAVFRSGHATAVLIGDALHPVRLQVGAGLNQGLQQAAHLAEALGNGGIGGWERHTLDHLAPWVELGRSRAHRSNLGVYEPVHPGSTAVPAADMWSTPEWVTA